MLRIAQYSEMRVFRLMKAGCIIHETVVGWWEYWCNWKYSTVSRSEKCRSPIDKHATCKQTTHPRTCQLSDPSPCKNVSQKSCVSFQLPTASYTCILLHLGEEEHNVNLEKEYKKIMNKIESKKKLDILLSWNFFNN